MTYKGRLPNMKKALKKKLVQTCGSHVEGAALMLKGFAGVSRNLSHSCQLG